VYVDKKLVCSACNDEFVYTAAEQEFYATVGFGEGPSRCPMCRGGQTADAAAGDDAGFAQEYAEANREQLFAASCVRCGETTRVPARMVLGDGTIYWPNCITRQL